MPRSPTRVRALLGGSIVITESDQPPGRSDPTIVVGLHGWGRDRSDLEDLLDLGAAMTIDLPGHGGSPVPDAACGTREYADTVARALDERAVVGAVVVGHSFGGRVAVRLAAQRPDLVGAVLLSGTPLLRASGAGRPARAMRLAKRARSMRLISEARLDAVRYRHGSADYRAATGVMREVLVRVVNEDYRDDLASITQPMTMLWGCDDTAAAIHMARQAYALVADPVRFIEVPGGHFAFAQHTAVMNEAISELRERLR